MMLCGMGVCFQCIDPVSRHRTCMDKTRTASDVDADVVVVGAGPGGMAAACHAAEAGRRVVVFDAAARPGGQIWRHRDRATLPSLARRWLARFDRSGARFVPRTEVVTVPSAPAVILATGARERYLPFPGWTLPGVLGIGGAQALLKNAMMNFSGRRVIIAGSGPLMLPVAASLTRAGATVLLVAEQAPGSRVMRFAASLWRSPGRARDAILYRAAFAGTPYRFGTWVTRAETDNDGLRVTLSHGRQMTCDILCTGYGLIPSNELGPSIGGAVDAALIEGAIAGRTAVGLPISKDLIAARARHRAFAARMDETFALRPELRSLADADTVICRCEGVTYGALDAAWSPRQAKLYTRIGMGPCQGRVCGPVTEYLFGWPRDVPRPPVLPTPVRALL